MLEEPIVNLLKQADTKEAKLGILHANKIMEMVWLHSRIQENKHCLFREWDVSEKGEVR